MLVIVRMYFPAAMEDLRLLHLPPELLVVADHLPNRLVGRHPRHIHPEPGRGGLHAKSLNGQRSQIAISYIQVIPMILCMMFFFSNIAFCEHHFPFSRDTAWAVS